VKFQNFNSFFYGPAKIALKVHEKLKLSKVGNRHFLLLRSSLSKKKKEICRPSTESSHQKPFNKLRTSKICKKKNKGIYLEKLTKGHRIKEKKIHFNYLGYHVNCKFVLKA
jgi:hypothetical protein